MAVAVGNHLAGGGLNHIVNHRRRRSRVRSFAPPDFLEFPPPPPLFPRSRSTPCFSSPSSSDDSSHCRRRRRHSAGVLSLIAEAALAITIGSRLVPAANGLGGAFFLHGPAGERLAVLKPIDETSPMAFIPPRSSADICVREAAAYLLDHAGFAGVPPTALIRISHPAFSSTTCIASIQRFVPHDFDAGDLGPSRFSVPSVHRIGILDARLLNTDRHAGNLLARNCAEESIELVPIDHGLCLPELLDDPYFEWLHWPQAAVPFSDREIEYVSKLDPFKDAEMLRVELPGVREPALRILILCTTFLKLAVKAGLCLADIGGMMTREFRGLKEPESALEELCRKTEETMAAESRHFELHQQNYIREEDEKMEFQFAIDSEEDDDINAIPLFLNCKRNKNLGKLDKDDNVGKDYEKGEEEGEREGGIMKKSVSFSAGESKRDDRRINGCKAITFMNMDDEEWSNFLNSFQKLLPEAFDVRKGMEMKQRLGSSCKF